MLFNNNKNRTNLILAPFILLSLLLLAVSVIRVRRGINSSNSQGQTIDEQNRTLETQMQRELPDFPIYHGVEQNRLLTKSGNEYRLNSLIDETVDTAMFWYYDELEEDGWQIIEFPDISNPDRQTMTAEKESYRAEIKVKSEGNAVRLEARVFPLK